MKFTRTEIPDIVIIEPDIFEDERGYFFESFRQDQFEREIGKINFIQENESFSQYGVLRGLHYQIPPYEQSKLVRVVLGRVQDIAVDLRKESPTFGLHFSIELSAENRTQLFIPKGFAHGYLTLSQSAIFHYKVDEYYNRLSESGIIYNDPKININWQLKYESILLSHKDMKLPFL